MGFTRGGSNLLLNLLRSHPNVCSPRGETQEVFRGKSTEPYSVRLAKRLRYLPILMLQKQDVFSIYLWEPRKELSLISKKIIDHILYYDKIKALNPDQNLYKWKNTKYKIAEIFEARILCKNLNGLIFMTKDFAKMYPDSTFIALIRNGFAVCEGQLRRGHDLNAISQKYNLGCQQMIKDSQKIPNYFIFRFEDILINPYSTLNKIYKVSKLDIKEVKQIRLQTKKTIDKRGQHHLQKGIKEKTVIWYKVNNFGRHFNLDVNENQMKQLKNEHRSIILKNCRDSLEYFGYI